MKELLELILQNITTHPDEASVEESSEEGRVVYTISVHPDDMGRVIGKDGKVIRAIRSLAHVVAVRQGQRYRISLLDGNEPPAPAVAPVNEAVAEPETEVAPEAIAEEAPAEAPEEDDLIADTIDIPDDAPAVETSDETPKSK